MASTREIRILLLGDDGVGKSTLITTLIKETFIEQIQHVVPEVTIPPEWTRENATTRIVDSSAWLGLGEGGLVLEKELFEKSYKSNAQSNANQFVARPENRDQLDSEIRKADVICIVYSIDRIETINRVSLFWLPYIRRLGRNVPVVLVGNKIDLRASDVANVSLEEQVMPIMNEFKEVETCVECSAKASLNVSEVFYFAQKAVLHPTAPLYDSREHVLKHACISALRRIFKLCDVDKNNYLNDGEIDNFQRKCFGTPLQRHELESVKAVVRQNEPEGVADAGLSEIGFIFLHTLFIQRGRLETTWTVLRTFGYGDDLTLREDFLFPPILVPADCSVELSSDGYQFLTDLHQIFDKDNDGALNQQELDALFSTAPYIPWEESGVRSITNQNGSLTLQGFLAQWSMTTLLNYKTTLAYFAYLGFPDKDTTKGLKVTRSKKIDLKKGKVQRDVFLAYVFGAAGSGKTIVLKSFINQDFSESYIPTTSAFSVVNSVEIRGSEKYLVMQEFGPAFDAEVLQNKKKLEACDLICMVYDSADTNSFAYVANLREKYNLDDLPVVFIATKSDLDLVAQRYTLQPDVYCRSLGLVVPMSVSIKTGGASKDLFRMLVGVCMNPSIAIIPKSPFSSKNKKIVSAFTATAVSVCVLALIVGVWYRASSSIKPSK